MKIPELEELYARYRSDLYRYCCFLTHDPVWAEDLLSETFLRVLRRLPTFRGEGSVKTWLFGIARNVWIEELRRRHPALSLDDPDAILERCLGQDNLPACTDARLALVRVRELLEQAPPRARQVVELRAKGYSYAEIAEKLQISEGSTRVLEHRTRQKLRDTLQKEGFTDE